MPKISPAAQLKPNINDSAAYGYSTTNDDEEPRGVLTIDGLAGDNNLTWVEVQRYEEEDGNLPGHEAGLLLLLHSFSLLPLVLL